ncbi:MAG: glycosyltransferase family 61 protein [Cyanobacteria bacterium RM1_2_2]|nr:glycosyltransferase family 61 protein [Cyanobacteria bacterium RM1_2_2]
MIKTIRKLYYSLPRSVQRQFLRTVSFLSFVRRAGVLICNDYIQLSIHNVEQVVGKYKQGIKFHQLVEENTKATRSASHLDGQTVAAIQPLIAKTETVILDITQAEFSLRNNHLFDPKLNAIDECGLQFEKMPVHRKLLSKTARKIDGTMAYLSNVEPSNYYHWMCRTLPLVRVYQQFFDLQEIDFFYVGDSELKDFHKESLARVGIKPAQILQEACTADRILAAISTRTKQFGSAPVIQANYDFSRGLFRQEIETNAAIQRHRIYVQRGDVKRRKVINESQVIEHLSAYDFIPVRMDNKTLLEQVQIFSQAEMIVAPHGAALTNLLFVQPEVKVIELMPWGYVNNCFYVLSNYAGADYFYLQSEAIEQKQALDEHYLDLYVDIKKLDAILQKALLESFNNVA